MQELYVHVDSKSARESLDFFFDDSFPIVKPSMVDQPQVSLSKKTIAMALGDELIRDCITIGSDYARLMISVMRYNIANNEMANGVALNGTISWLASIIKRNDVRGQRKGILNNSELDNEAEGPELNGLELYTFNLKIGDDEISYQRYLHSSIIKHFSTVIKREVLKGVSNTHSINLSGLDLSSLKGVNTAVSHKGLYVELLMDMVITGMYCPLLLFDWILCGKLEVALECGGDIFDKDFYIMDMKSLVELFELTDRNDMKEFIELELYRNTEKSNNVAEKIVAHWKQVMCESFESDSAFKGALVFVNNTELDGSEEKRVVVVNDIVNYRSDFFKLMSQSGMRESTDDFITLDCSGVVMRSVFEFTYTGSILDESVAPELMLYSDMIGYKMLFNTCAHIIKKNIKSIEDACNIYRFARMYEEIPYMTNLKCYCAKFCYIAKRFSIDSTKLPDEIVNNEPFEEFKLFYYIQPATGKVPSYNYHPPVHVIGWREKSGLNRFCNIIARGQFKSPPIFTNEGHIKSNVINSKTDWKNTSASDVLIVCVPVTLNDKEEFFEAIEEMLRVRKSKFKQPYRALAIVLTKCDLPLGMWKISRKEMSEFAATKNVFLFESSAFLKINCTQPCELLHSLQN